MARIGSSFAAILCLSLTTLGQTGGVSYVTFKTGVNFTNDVTFSNRPTLHGVGLATISDIPAVVSITGKVDKTGDTITGILALRGAGAHFNMATNATDEFFEMQNTTNGLDFSLRLTGPSSLTTNIFTFWNLGKFKSGIESTLYYDGTNILDVGVGTWNGTSLSAAGADLSGLSNSVLYIGVETTNNAGLGSTNAAAILGTGAGATSLVGVVHGLISNEFARVFTATASAANFIDGTPTNGAVRFCVTNGGAGAASSLQAVMEVGSTSALAMYITAPAIGHTGIVIRSESPAVTIGPNATNTGNGVVIGASATAESGVAIGPGSKSVGSGVSISAGLGSIALDAAVAIGRLANAPAHTVAIGNVASAGASGVNVSIGENTVAGTYGTSLGGGANSDYGAAVGYQANGTGIGAALGYQAKGVTYGAAIGYTANGGTYGVAIGNEANGNAHGIAVGDRASTLGAGTNRIVIGRHTTNELNNTIRVRGSLYLDGGTNTVNYRTTFGAGAWTPATMLVITNVYTGGVMRIATSDGNTWFYE